METALISLVCVAIIVIGTATTMMTSFNAASTVAGSLKEMEMQAEDVRRTEIDALDNNDVGGGDIYITVENDGQTSLAQFSRWDVIAMYQDGGTDYSTYLEYTTDNPPGNNRWTVDGIYLPNDDPEAWDPDILNPGEKVKLLIDLNPLMAKKTYGRITASTPNGVTSQAVIYRR